MLHTFSETLRIGTVNTVYECYLLSSVKEYIHNHPDISVKVMIDHSGPLLRMLQDGTLDIVFSYVPLKKTSISCHPFHSDELVLVTAPIHTEYRDGIYQAQLPDVNYLYCDFMIQDNGTFIRDMFPKNYSFSFEIDKLTHLPAYLTSGIGYSFLPKSLAQSYLDDGSLISVPLLDFQAPTIQSFVILPESKMEHTSITNFIDTLSKEVPLYEKES